MPGGAAGSLKRKAPMKIGTHNGTFHCDEALGTWMLLHTEQFSGAEVVRSRDPAVLKECDIVIDVGKINKGVLAPPCRHHPG